MKAAPHTLLKFAVALLITAGFQASVAFTLPPAMAQSGPNCFNTTLLALGYTDDVTYTSSDELEFYLKKYCSEVESKAANVVTFSNDQLVHTAFKLPNGLILEKNSLYGTLTPVFEYDPAPGQYLIHEESKSLFSTNNSSVIFGETYKRRTYQCLPSTNVKLDLAKMDDPAIKEQLQYRKFISAFVFTNDRKTLEVALNDKILPAIKTLKWDTLARNKMDKTSKDYLIALLRSNAYQTHLLLCAESQRTQGECYTPKLTEVKEALDQWFNKIYDFEN